jgi:hypothetical protein
VVAGDGQEFGLASKDKGGFLLVHLPLVLLTALVITTAFVSTNFLVAPSIPAASRRTEAEKILAFESADASILQFIFIHIHYN